MRCLALLTAAALALAPATAGAQMLLLGVGRPHAAATSPPTEPLYDAAAGVFSGAASPYSYTTPTAAMPGTCAAGSMALLLVYDSGNAITVPAGNYPQTSGGDTFSTVVSTSASNRYGYLFAHLLTHAINAGDTVAIPLSSNATAPIVSLLCLNGNGSAIQSGSATSTTNAGATNPSMTFTAPADLVAGAHFTSGVPTAPISGWATITTRSDGAANGTNNAQRWYYKLAATPSPDATLSVTTTVGNTLMGWFPITP